MITTIAVLTASLGAVLLLWLFLRIRAVDAELRLKRHRCRDAGLADLLNYAAMVDDGVIVGKNGAFLAAWLYKGADNASSTDAQREAPPPPGSWVTFRYRGLTAQGVPRFASFLRLHEGA